MIDYKALQKKLGITADGIPGPLTYAALFEWAGAKPAIAAALGRSAAKHFDLYGITTPLRLAHFLGQTGHESGGFRYTEEIASGAAYEGRKDLGNTQPGDGKRFKGRGILMLTGRANYRSYGKALGINLEGDPQQAAEPETGLLIVLRYWSINSLNGLADADNGDKITRKINGGTNGSADRVIRTLRAKALLS
ncbi:glycoside hydrolase [Sphingomonas sp. Leaf357]|uniref:glycoside hydrolase n=1 Tax=Sphingomonas sp. Leaf357 TaxID=1736350 RepID=UPI0006FC8CD0|nr:glycoside hydrolase [Sphingomonas sp. Leaf357]KQS01514.1 glycoside hydrolase [Sphingomonas sp. Leaf357]